MTKKIKDTTINTTEETIVATTPTTPEQQAAADDLRLALADRNHMMLANYMEQFPKVSLRKLAEVAQVSYPRLLKASKQPIEGQVYDPTKVNYVALEAILTSKEILIASLPWDEMNKQCTRPEGTLTKDMDKFEIGCTVWLRKDSTTPCTLVYKTKTHVVLRWFNSEELICWSHNTFLLNGPAFQPRA